MLLIHGNVMAFISRCNNFDHESLITLLTSPPPLSLSPMRHLESTVTAILLRSGCLKFILLNWEFGLQWMEYL